MPLRLWPLTHEVHCIPATGVDMGFFLDHYTVTPPSAYDAQHKLFLPIHSSPLTGQSTRATAGPNSLKVSDNTRACLELARLVLIRCFVRSKENRGVVTSEAKTVG